jgi:hypothetical protein
MSKKAKKLPTPRIQLRWEASDERHGYQWKCHYELVIQLGEYDIRREVYKDGMQLRKKLPRELLIPIKEPSWRGSSQTPCGQGDHRYADTPYRDGAHAMWDGIQLGTPPIYSIAPDGQAFLVEYSEEIKNGRAKP